MGLVNRFMEKLRLCHLLATKKILRYIRGTHEHGVLIPNQQSTRMEAKVYVYYDSYWSGDQDDRKNTLGYLFMLGLGQISGISNM